MRKSKCDSAPDVFESRAGLRFTTGGVTHALMPPHEIDGYQSFSHPFSIGVSFTGHRDAVTETASGRRTNRTLPPGTWGTTGGGGLKWVRVLEPSESLTIYPAPTAFSRAPEEIRRAWQQHSADLLVGRFDPTIWATCARFRRAALGALVISELEAESLIGDLLTHVAVRYLGARPPERIRGKLSSARLARVTDMIEARLHDPPTLRELATTAAMSPFHFQRTFFATTGLSPHAYVSVRRAERARRMLNEPGMTVAKVARILGFAEPSHLRRAFRRQFNSPPQIFERQFSCRCDVTLNVRRSILHLR